MEQVSKILIVDDEAIGRQLLEAILFPENYDLYFAENGNQAYEKALQLMPDLILMDVMMPGMDGFEVCKKLREHTILKNVPILLITALDDRDSMISGLDSGADDYISKPFDRIEVLTKVKNITQLDRYKRILHDTDKPDAEEKNSPNKELSLYYTSLIQKSLLPSHEYISRLLPSYFIIIRSVESVSRNIFWVSEKNDKIIIVLYSRKYQGISDILMNILGVTNLNRIIYKRDKIDTGEIINDLKIELQKNDLNPEQGSTALDNINIALCVFDKVKLKLQYSGVNIPLFYVKDNKAAFAEANILYRSTKNPDSFNSVTIDLSEGDSFYIFSDKLFHHFEKDNETSGNKDLLTLIQEQQSGDTADRESFFTDYIDKELSENDDLKDIILFGVRI